MADTTQTPGPDGVRAQANRKPSQSRLDAMPVQDALCDAECLRLVAIDLTYWDADVSAQIQAQTACSDLYLARWQGGRSSVLDETICTPDLSAACARIAARAAFRACPGLRGDA